MNQQRKFIVCVCLWTLLLGLLSCCGGCAWQPNGWNTNVYTGEGKPYYSIGISGAIPPYPWWKTPDSK